MKSKGLGWGLVGIVALSMLGCPGKEQAPVNASPTMEVASVTDSDKNMVSPGIDVKWKGLTTLDAQILEDVNALWTDFSRRQFAAMATLLEARYAVISGRNYRLMYGGDSAGFWESVYSEDVTPEITVAIKYISNVSGPFHKLPRPEKLISNPSVEDSLEMGLTKPEDVFDAVAFVICEIHIIKKTDKGALISNDTYSMSLCYPHRTVCVWAQ